jgi:hypothetical protein
LPPAPGPVPQLRRAADGQLEIVAPPAKRDRVEPRRTSDAGARPLAGT